jgi:hypothetical protein
VGCVIGSRGEVPGERKPVIKFGVGGGGGDDNNLRAVGPFTSRK